MFTNAKMVIRAGALMAVLATSANASWLDRWYKFGDEVGFEFPVVDMPPASFGAASVDSQPNFFTPPGVDGFHDVQSGGGGPLYTHTDTTGRPGAAAGEWGFDFNGTGHHLYIDGTAPAAAQLTGALGIPISSDTDPKYENLVNWNTLDDRHMEGWVRPTGAAATARQDIISDTAQFTIFISAPVAGVRYWGMTHGDPNVADDDVIVNSALPVEFGEWAHVMQRSFGGDAVLYVDGIGVAHTTNNSDTTTEAADPANFVFGAGQDKISNFFAGQVDEFKFYVSGDNSTQAGPPAGRNWGAVDMATENDAIRQALVGSPVGDVDLDDALDEDDVTAFIAGWGAAKTINGFQVGDLSTRMRGDFDFDGDIDLSDALTLRNALNAAGSGVTLNLSSLGNVPEPGSILLAAMALLGVFGVRRRS